MDATRSVTAPLNKPFLWPFCPRAPKKAPVPPVIAEFLLPAGGPGGDGIPLLNPKVIIVPTGVPSLCRISYVSSRNEGQVVSAIASTPGTGVGLVQVATPRTVYVPLVGWPFTGTTSAYPMIGTPTHPTPIPL